MDTKPLNVLMDAKPLNVFVVTELVYELEDAKGDIVRIPVHRRSTLVWQYSENLSDAPPVHLDENQS